MKEIKFIILISIMLLLNIMMISAQILPGSIQKTDTGYEIQSLDPVSLKQNTSYTFSFHVFNASNGYPLLDNNTRCDFHLYNQSGLVILSKNQFPRTEVSGVNNEFEIFINEFNTSTLGTYNYIFQCNNSVRSLGGWFSSEYEVTTSGRMLEVQESILHFQYFFLLLIIAIVFLVLAFVFNMGENKFVSIFFLSLGIMVIVVNFGYVLNVINNYQENFSFINSIFNNMFYLLMILLTVGGIAVVVGLLAYVFQAFSKLRYGGK